MTGMPPPDNISIGQQYPLGVSINRYILDYMYMRLCGRYLLIREDGGYYAEAVEKARQNSQNN